MSDLKTDLKRDLAVLAADITSGLLKFTIACFVLLKLFLMEYNAAVGTAALLGYADFFDRRHPSQTADEVRTRINRRRRRC